MTLRSLAFAASLAGAVLSAAPALALQIDTPARHVVLMDVASGEILFEKAGDMPMPPASMSKLMTIEMVFAALKSGELSMDDTFHVSENAWAMKKAGTEAGQGSLMYVAINDDIKVSDLLRGIIIQSGNDACVVVAEGMAGSDAAFAERMNERAKEIGMTGSHFANSYGWPDPEEYVTARDLAVLARHLINDYPDYYPMFAEREFTWEGIKQYNRNPLLGSAVNSDGLKTGHTEASGYGLVASATQDGRRLILVVNGLGSQPERKNESLRLMQIGFREFRTYDLLAANQIVAAAPVFGGGKSEVALVVRQPVTRILNREARKGMRVTVEYNSPLVAPLREGDEVGTLRVSVPDAPDVTVPVVVAQSVGRMGPVTAIGAGLGRVFSGLMGSGDAEPEAAPATPAPAPAQTSENEVSAGG